jgi:hypothetical protein
MFSIVSTRSIFPDWAAASHCAGVKSSKATDERSRLTRAPASDTSSAACRDELRDWCLLLSLPQRVWPVPLGLPWYGRMMIDDE